MDTAFDVPGTVRLKDVSRPAAGETPAEAIHRLAAKARIEGVRLLMEHDSEDIFATSSRMDGIVYRVSAAGCTCQGFLSFGRCKHHSLYLVETGTAPTDPAPAEAATVACPGCHGDAFLRITVGGRFSDSVGGALPPLRLDRPRFGSRRRGLAPPCPVCGGELVHVGDGLLECAAEPLTHAYHGTYTAGDLAADAFGAVVAAA